MLAAGAKAPDIKLPDLDGHSWNLTDLLKDGPVLLAFFKISCSTCQLTFPFLQRLADSRDGSAPRLLAISQDDATASRGFQERLGVSMPTLLDVPRSWPASNAYQIASVPSLFLVETDGKISLASEGFDKAAIESLGERFHVAPFKESDRVPDLRPG
ncbi:MAG TPA: TlpA disulfide reductase family protein [Bryobacteraceae bacterium]|jgi:peroxiredoxin|nr:TlpA disulfide reductase family protein [Bryobacteraceae bacterium]